MCEHLEDIRDGSHFIPLTPGSPQVCHLIGAQSIPEEGREEGGGQEEGREGGGRRGEEDSSFIPLPPLPAAELIHLPSIKAKFGLAFISVYTQNVLEF